MDNVKLLFYFALRNNKQTLYKGKYNSNINNLTFTIMATTYFKNITEDDRFIIADMCKSIEDDKIFFVSTDKKFKMLVRGNTYTYDYTFNLIRFGFATKARGTDFQAKQHAYCPNQYTAQVQANFINTAVEMGLYTRQTNKEFNGGNNVQIIWM